MAVLTSKEVMSTFRIGSTTTVQNLFHMKGSPAFKIGRNWVVDEDDFKMFLQKQSEKFKG